MVKPGPEALPNRLGVEQAHNTARIIILGGILLPVQLNY